MKSERQVICIKHPSYDGLASPVLSCKTCCRLYIAEIKRQSAETQHMLDETVAPENVAESSSVSETHRWLEEKRREAHEAMHRYRAELQPERM